MGRLNYTIAHTIFIDPKAARDLILEALRENKMHMGRTALSIGCTHGTLLSWIHRLEAVPGIAIEAAIMKLKSRALNEGWHFVNRGNRHEPIPEAPPAPPKKSRKKASESAPPARKALKVRRASAA